MSHSKSRPLLRTYDGDGRPLMVQTQKKTEENTIFKGGIFHTTDPVTGSRFKVEKDGAVPYPENDKKQFDAPP